MASSSLDITSTSASNEIEEVEENTNPIQNPVLKKVNATENGENPASKSLPQDPKNKKPSTFSKLLKSKSKKPKPTKENNPITAEETKQLEEEKSKKKEEEDKKQREEETKKEIEMISKSINADLTLIGHASERITNYKVTFEDAKKKFEEIKKGGNAKDLRELKMVIKALKQKISTQDKVDSKEKEALINQLGTISIANAQEANAMQLGMMPNLFNDLDFERTLHFQDFKALYNELPLELKLCLLCFSVFPEDVEIKRRVMVYWWIGEEFVPPRKDRPEERTNQQHWDKFDLTKKNPQEGDRTPEHWANFYFGILLKMGFIETAQKKPNPKVDTCKMHPFVRTMVIRFAQKAEFFEFDKDGIVNEKFSKSLRACLLAGKNLTENNKLLENIHAIFNVDVAILDFKHDFLLNMKNANVLYLGRWKNLGTHHIEIDDTKILNAKSGKILDGLQNIRNLRFLSFQGISRIAELPKSVLKLRNLTILDIRACHNLETIPDDIQYLVNLTHLDMSECYLLDKMPKGISKLTKLQVLSGFVVVESANGNTCSLVDLKGFPHLRKLSIHTGSDKFPSNKDLQALNQFKALTKLTIAWGRGSANAAREYNFAKSTTLAKGANKEAQDINDQIPKGDDNKEGKLKGKAVVMQSREIIEMSQESPKNKEGKGILKGAANEASTSSKQVASPSNVIYKKSEENKVTQDEQSPKGKPNSAFPSKSKWPTKKGFLKRFSSPRLDSVISKIIAKKKISKIPSSKQKQEIPAELPSHLTKLDLQCLPETPLTWLRPEKLLKLKKLYIRGGKLSDLGQFQDFENDSFNKPKWEQVEELRLKYLDELEMEWRELLELFPKLDYLEKVHCPKLSFFPCDEIGVWTKKKIIS